MIDPCGCHLEIVVKSIKCNSVDQKMNTIIRVVPHKCFDIQANVLIVQ